MLHQVSLVAVLDRFRDQCAADVAVVDEAKLKVSVAARRDRFADDTGYGHGVCLRVHGDQIVRDLAAVGGVYGIPQLTVARGVEKRPSLRDQGEGNIGMSDRETAHQLVDVAGLGHRSLQKLASGWDIVENVTHDHRCSLRTACFLEGNLLPSLDAVTASEIIISVVREQLDARNGRDTGKRLTAETEAVYPEQIRTRFDLACCVTQECRADVVRSETGAVVRNTEHGDTSLLRFNGDPGRAGIQRIFHKLFHDRGRAFDNFPGRDLIDSFLI